MLHTEALRLMEEEAERRHGQIEYLFATKNPKLIPWAETKGREIFGWTGFSLWPDRSSLLAFVTIDGKR